MAKLTGTGKDDLLATGDGGDTVNGRAGNDSITGGAGGDWVVGGGGDDWVAAGKGDDVIYGDGTTPAGFDRFKVHEDYTAHIVFQGESAGYKNGLGAFTYDEAGNITGVKILFANASLKGSGGDLEAGKSAVDMDIHKGERLGFFVVPNGFAKSDLNAKLLSMGGNFSLKGLEGEAGNVLGSKSLTLWYTDPATGKATKIVSEYGDQIFASLVGLNRDGLDHVHSSVDPATGTAKIGFEDLLNGGDKDFDDSVFTVDVGKTNAGYWSEAWKVKTLSNNDSLSGGEGQDQIYGMGGNDSLDGGAGDDKLYGNSGKDVLWGGDGNDLMSGGKEDDRLDGGAGNDTIKGNSGNDWLADGLGDDNVKGGTGDDTVMAGKGGKDVYDGGKGFDTLDYSGLAGKHGINANLSKHTITSDGLTDTVKNFEKLIGTGLNDRLVGSKNADQLFGEAGDDIVRGKQGSDLLAGGEGHDVFLYKQGDWARGSLDHIADFNVKEDVLDLQGLLTGKYAGSLKGVAMHDTAEGTVVSLVIGKGFKDIAVLDGVHGLTVSDLHDAGALVL